MKLRFIFCIWVCNYWSLLVIPTALVGCVGASAFENRGKRREKKITTKNRVFYILSEHWELPFSCLQPELVDFFSTSLFTPGIHSWFKLQLYQAEGYWRETDGPVPLVQLYFKPGILLWLVCHYLLLGGLKYKLHAFDSGFIVVFRGRDGLSVLIPSYLELTYLSLIAFLWCIYFFFSYSLSHHLTSKIIIKIQVGLFKILYLSDRLIFSHERLGILAHYFIHGFWPICKIMLKHYFRFGSLAANVGLLWTGGGHVMGKRQSTCKHGSLKSVTNDFWNFIQN